MTGHLVMPSPAPAERHRAPRLTRCERRTTNEERRYRNVISQNTMFACVCESCDVAFPAAEVSPSVSPLLLNLSSVPTHVSIAPTSDPQYAVRAAFSVAVEPEPK